MIVVGRLSTGERGLFLALRGLLREWMSDVGGHLAIYPSGEIVASQRAVRELKRHHLGRELLTIITGRRAA